MDRVTPGSEPAKSRTLVLATTNRGKLAELSALLSDLSVRVVGTDQVLPAPPVIVEDAATFEGNALKKAATVAHATGMLALADDSGLEVDALGGLPGVRSARFAHETASDAENNQALLAALSDVPDGERGARFRCALSLVAPDGRTATVTGVCHGQIARALRGTHGFGYDPLFIVEGSSRTMAELTPSEKGAESHRARALAALRPILQQWLAELDGSAAP